MFYFASYCTVVTSTARGMHCYIVIIQHRVRSRGAAYRSRFVRCKQEEVQEDFVDQRVFDYLFSETQQRKQK